VQQTYKPHESNREMSQGGMLGLSRTPSQQVASEGKGTREENSMGHHQEPSP
jgi:hypothetical protein